MSLRAPLSLESLKAKTDPRWQWFGADETLGECWCASGRGVRLCRGGYARMDVRIRGLGQETRRLSMHLVAWLLDHLGPMSRDDLWLAYCEVRASGLQFDHRCEMPNCIRPSHLAALVTQSENIMAGKDRSNARALKRDLEVPRPLDEYEEEEPLPF
jgi:hypothetical protein